jgi:hypothetical protein
MSWDGKNSRGKATASQSGIDPKKIDFTKLEAINDTVVFYWVDDESLEFKTGAGIIIQRNLRKDRDRWGCVVSTGPKVTQVAVGEYILPEKVNNPFGAVYQGLEVWATAEENIILASSDYEDTKTY